MIQMIGQAFCITVAIAIAVFIATDGNELGVEICKAYIKALLRKQI